MEYSWPGNVRELENMVERALIHFRGKSNREYIVFTPFINEMLKSDTEEEQAVYDLPLQLDKMTQVHIIRVLEQTKGKVHGPGGAAELLGINANTLRSKMQKLNIPFGKNRQ